MKKFLAAGLLIAVGFCAACAVIRPWPLHRNWKWDGVNRVMPHSVFEPVAQAREAAAQSAAPGTLPKGSQREEFSLNGPWRYRPDAEVKGESEKWFMESYDDAGWKTMAVPNNFSIDDPALKNFFQPVWFRRSFQVPASFSNKRLRLVFESVDYFAKVWLNGELLGAHEGYFNPFMFDITDKVKPGRNVLVVKVTNPWDVSMAVAQKHSSTNTAEKIWVKSVFTFHDSRPGGYSDSAADSQSFGTGGICRPVKIVATGQVALDWALISPRLTENYTRAEVNFDVFLTNFSASPQEALIQIKTEGENFEGYGETLAAQATLAPGPNKVRLSLKVSEPKLWWPWDHPELGQPILYRARFAVSAAGQTTDEMHHLFGIKEVKLDETGPEAFFWYVNGKRLFFRGTNGLPTEYYSRITPEYLRDYFAAIKDNNMDILIVHDHQAPPLVYEQADREGIVILQNFTLIWEVNVCNFVRESGDPNLTGNPEIMGRMATEAIWYLYNHPAIFWWSMHDESAHIGLKGRGLAHANFCRTRPYELGETIPLYQDLSLNLDLDNQLIRIARSLNTIIPMHRTGGLETDSVTWYGWYKRTYFDLFRDPEAFPLEFGGEAVSYSLAGVMNYFADWWPIASERGVKEWEYHALEVPYHETYVGRSIKYGSFNEWAFASQLYQAVVIKYHIEINRENKYHPTGSAIQYMLNDWWASVNFGYTDWNLVEKISQSWTKRAFSPQLAATRVDHNIHEQGEKIELPVHLLNDQYLDFPKARLAWKIVEETDSFIIKGQKLGGTIHWVDLLAPGNALQSYFKVPVTATIGHQVPVATALAGQTVRDLPPDGHLIATTIVFHAPKTREIKHYTLYLTLSSADGRVLSENRDHFIVVPDRKKFDPPEGLSPAPRFTLELDLQKAGAPLASAPVVIADKYFPDKKYQVTLDASGRGRLAEMVPGAYVLSVAGETYEFLLNHDDQLELDFRPGLKTTLGVKPLIEWQNLDPNRPGAEK